MFLYGDQIVNDHNCDILLNHLFSIKAVRGRDYVYYSKDKIILKPTLTIKSSPLCFYHQIMSVNHFHKVIG